MLIGNMMKDHLWSKSLKTEFHSIKIEKKKEFRKNKIKLGEGGSFHIMWPNIYEVRRKLRNL